MTGVCFYEEIMVRNTRGLMAKRRTSTLANTNLSNVTQDSRLKHLAVASSHWDAAPKEHEALPRHGD